MKSEPSVSPRSSLAIVSMVLGIVSIYSLLNSSPIRDAIRDAINIKFSGSDEVYNIATGIAGLGLAAIITGLISLQQIEKQGRRGKNLALVGMILGAVTLAVAILIYFYVPVMVIILMGFPH